VEAVSFTNKELHGEAQRASEAAASRSNLEATSKLSVRHRLEEASTKEKEAMAATASTHKWATAALLVRMVGSRLHGRLLAAVGTSMSYAMFSVASAFKPVSIHEGQELYTSRNVVLTAAIETRRQLPSGNTG